MLENQLLSFSFFRSQKVLISKTSDGVEQGDQSSDGVEQGDQSSDGVEQGDQSSDGVEQGNQSPLHIVVSLVMKAYYGNLQFSLPLIVEQLIKDGSDILDPGRFNKIPMDTFFDEVFS